MIIKDDTSVYGNRVTFAGAVLAFVVLVAFAGYTLLDSAFLMSNSCTDATGQVTCPSSGPDWLRPVPGGAASLGAAIGLVGFLAGRPARTPVMVAGFVVVALALAGSRLLAG